MRIPYLDFGLDRRLQWSEEDQRRHSCAEEIHEIIENSHHLDITMLQRLRDLLDRKIERCAALKNCSKINHKEK